MGAEAKSAVPALLAAAKESDATLARCAGEALKKVAPDDAAKAGIR